MFRKSAKVRDHMLRRPVLVKPDDDLFHAIHQILAYKISGVTVIDESRHPVGMLSELDALQAILHREYHQEDVGTILVRDHMTENVDCIGVNEDIIGVAQSMLDRRQRRRPVLDDHGIVVGQVTCRQLLKGIQDMSRSGEKGR